MKIKFVYIYHASNSSNNQYVVSVTVIFTAVFGTHTVCQALQQML